MITFAEAARICRVHGRKHTRRAASGYLFGCAVYEAARRLNELLPGGTFVHVVALAAFLAALDEEADATLDREHVVPVLARGEEW